MKKKFDTAASFESLEQNDGGEDVTRPLGVGSFGADAGAGAEESSGGSLKLRSSSILLAVVVLLAVVGLFSMRTLAKVTAVVSGNQEMEQVIEEFLNSSAGRSVLQLSNASSDAVAKSNRVLQVLNESYTEQQVPLEDVQKDPFLIFDPAPIGPAGDEGPVKPNQLELARAERRQQLSTIASRLSLKSVMLGEVPLANINGQIVRQGEIITVMPERQEFEVLSIDTDLVRLAANDLNLGVRIEVDVTINRDSQGGRKR